MELKVWYIFKIQGFKCNNKDSCLCVKKFREGQLITLILYVDDMLIARNSQKDFANLIKKLSSLFDMKYVSYENHILDMCITQESKKGLLYLSQKGYVHKVLEHFNM